MIQPSCGRPSRGASTVVVATVVVVVVVAVVALIHTHHCRSIKRYVSLFVIFPFFCVASESSRHVRWHKLNMQPYTQPRVLSLRPRRDQRTYVLCLYVNPAKCAMLTQAIACLCLWMDLLWRGVLRSTHACVPVQDSSQGTMTAVIDLHQALQPVVVAIQVYKQPLVPTENITWGRAPTFLVNVHCVEGDQFVYTHIFDLLQVVLVPESDIPAEHERTCIAKMDGFKRLVSTALPLQAYGHDLPPTRDHPQPSVCPAPPDTYASTDGSRPALFASASASTAVGAADCDRERSRKLLDHLASRASASLVRDVFDRPYLSI
jgi:hypothetical protein